jgi:hypothetical protein
MSRELRLQLLQLRLQSIHLLLKHRDLINLRPL